MSENFQVDKIARDDGLIELWITPETQAAVEFCGATILLPPRAAAFIPGEIAYFRLVQDGETSEWIAVHIPEEITKQQFAKAGRLNFTKFERGV